MRVCTRVYQQSLFMWYSRGKIDCQHIICVIYRKFISAHLEHTIIRKNLLIVFDVPDRYEMLSESSDMICFICMSYWCFFSFFHSHIIENEVDSGCHEEQPESCFSSLQTMLLLPKFVGLFVILLITK